MAVLSRLNYLSQQRLGLENMLATDSFTAFDFRSFSKSLFGSSKNYVVRGLEISSVSGLTVSISLKDCIVMSPLDNVSPFYMATSNDADVELTLPPATQNIFLEAYLEHDTSTPVTTAFFDTGATTVANPAGSEFTASADFQKIVEIKFRFTTSGFSADAIPVARLVSESTSITSITDSRPMFYRLATGGANPDPFHRFVWSNSREEPNVLGNPQALGQFNTSNPYLAIDANGAKNDKAIKNLKDWMDAMMTAVQEVKGTPNWYSPFSNRTGQNILFHTSNSTTINPNQALTVQWSQEGDGRLRTKGSGLPISWSANFGYTSWSVGGLFASSSTRTYTSNLFEIAVPDNSSVFIRLEREISPPSSSGNSVKWATESIGAGVPVANSVKGQEGDFTGIAIGDFVRKQGSEYYKYYKVTGFYDTALRTTTGLIATSACNGLRVQDQLTESLEPVIWFRSNYSQNDLFYSSSDGTQVTSADSSLTLDIDDISMYWLGRRKGTLFVLRDYGVLQQGEETLVGDDSDPVTRRENTQLFLRQDFGTNVSSAGVYSSLNSNILTIQKRSPDNTISDGTTNAYAWQTYTLAVTPTLGTDGDGLWVRLSDTQTASEPITSGTISSGTSNVFQVLPSNSNPLRSYDNKNVYLIARRVTIGGRVHLQFCDGTLVAQDGIALQKDLTKVVAGVTTSISGTTAVVHGFQRATNNFVWSARETTSGKAVWIGANHTTTGLTLDQTPDAAYGLTIVFSRDAQ